MTTITRPIGLTATLGAAVLLLAAPAPAAEPDPCMVATEWAQEVVAATQLPPPAGWTFVYECDRADGNRKLGWADRDDQTITLWIGATDREAWIAWTYVHEAAHAYDLATMTPDDRAFWRGVRGISREPDWWGERGLPAHEWAALPSEDLAEVFAACWLGEIPTDWPWRVAHAGPPGDGECQIVMHLVSPPAEAAAAS